jgi:hypothetical protein
MIQRIQTIYLVISLALVAFIFIVPIAHMAYNSEQFITFRATGFYDNASGTISIQTISLVILISISICLTGVSIFLFRKRVLQSRLCIIIMALLAGLEAVIIYNIIYFIQRIPGVNWSPGLSLIFPPVAIIMTWFAFRGIRRDESIVRESDRLR